MSTSDAIAEDGKVMSFREHLMELRKRLVRIVGVLVVGFFIAWELRLPIFEFLSRPIAGALADNGIYSFQTISLTESIVVYLKTAFFADLVFLSPYVFWEIWAFISPGLYQREKRFVLPLTGFSVAFFLLGSAFAYTVLLPFITDWLVNITLEGGHTDVMVTLQNTYSFAFSFLLMFGLAFQLPLVLFFLALWGSVTGRGLLKFWRYFVVISFIVSGVLTPPDPLSQVFMAVPLNVLYGFGVITAYTVTRARASGREDAGRLALRAMALSMLALLALGSGLFLYVGGLPQKPLVAWTPPEATFAAGMNPRVLAAEEAVLGLVRTSPEAAEALDRLTGTTPLDGITDGLIIGLADGTRAVLLRSDGLGKTPPEGAVALDDDTLALGSEGILATLAAIEPSTPSLGAEGDRLLTRLSGSGPLWVWLPPQSPAKEVVLGAGNAGELASVGAALSLGERRQIIFDLPLALGEGSGSDSAAERAERTARADRVLARIEAARVAALARPSDTRDAELARALSALATELEAVAPPRIRPRVRAIRDSLTRADARPDAAAADAFPALSALAPHLQGVSVRREDNRLTLTAELDDEGLAAIFDILAAR